MNILIRNAGTHLKPTTLTTLRKTMATVSTDLLKEGMTLDAPVKNAQGQVLFGAGHVLKEKHITMMMAWGIPEASVGASDSGDDEEAARRQELISRAEESLKPLFRRCDISHPVVSEILKCAAERKVSRTHSAS